MDRKTRTEQEAIGMEMRIEETRVTRGGVALGGRNGQGRAWVCIKCSAT